MSDEVTYHEMISGIRKKIWTVFLASGGITATVLYWISQLPPIQREAMKMALENFLKLPR